MFNNNSRFVDCQPQVDGTAKVYAKLRDKDALYRNLKGEDIVGFTITREDLLVINSQLGVFEV